MIYQVIYAFFKGTMIGLGIYSFYFIASAAILMGFVAVGAWEVNIPEDYDRWSKSEKAMYIIWAIIDFPILFVKYILGIE